MTRSVFASLVLSGAAVSAFYAGCSSDLPTGESPSPPPEFRTTGSPVLQDVLLAKLGRGLAMALADPAMRAWVRARIDASPYVEWRIPFREVLLHQAGLPQVRRVLGLTRFTSAERGRQKRLPQLELYLPIPEQRINWRASAPVQVAVRIGHSDMYTVYTMDGAASSSRGDHVPAVATLVLAPSEIDYGDLSSAVRGGSRTGPGMEIRLAAERAGSAIGTLALPQPPPPPPPPPPTGGANTARHTRLSYFKTTRYHDDWFGGNDEVEIFGSVYGGYQECTWRTDVSPNRDYYMDVANSFSTIATAIPWGTATLFIEAFEDDDGRCVRRPSDDRYGSTFLSIDQYGGTFGTSNPGHIAVNVYSKVP